MQGKLTIPGWVAEKKNISSSHSAMCVQQFLCISVLKLISKTSEECGELQPWKPKILPWDFHLSLAELWSHVQLLSAPSLNKPEADHGFRNSFVFYGLNSYTGLWPWSPQEKIWGGCCSQQDGPTWGGDNWDPKWEFLSPVSLEGNLSHWPDKCGSLWPLQGWSGISCQGVGTTAATHPPHGILRIIHWRGLLG